MPGSYNEVIIKADNYELMIDKLFINGRLQKDFYDLNVYYYKFKCPRQLGFYSHQVKFEGIRASGERVIMTQTLNYEVVDSCFK
ncbi:MAG: hypothetical protein JNL75_02995 [Chitinophagales bacterium]|nr:hypothetical protein [Chitinophagales bacterium]